MIPTSIGLSTTLGTPCLTKPYIQPPPHPLTMDSPTRTTRITAVPTKGPPTAIKAPPTYIPRTPPLPAYTQLHSTGDEEYTLDQFPFACLSVVLLVHVPCVSASLPRPLKEISSSVVSCSSYLSDSLRLRPLPRSRLYSYREANSPGPTSFNPFGL